MISLKSLIAITACWLAVSQAEAQLMSGIKLGAPAYGGTGCPAGSASVSLSPGEDAISILFDQYTTEAGGATMRRVDRKNCSISVPVTIPQGYSVSVIQTDFRGFNLVPSGGSNRMDTEYFWAGMRGPRYVRVFNGPQNADYTETNGVMAASLIWSPCGASINLRVNSSIMTQTNARNEQAMMTVDSADISSGLIYHIQWRQCQ
jgi:hypothetical protein